MMIEKISYFLINIFANYPYLVAFFAPIIGGGEIGVIFIAFLSAQGILSIWIVIIFGTLGLLTFDSICFIFIKSRFVNKLKNWNKIPEQYFKLEERLDSITKGKDSLFLFFIKLFIGTRILLIIYINARKISYKNFMYYDFLPTLVYCIIISFLGWIAGKGFYNIYKVYNNFQLAVLFLLIIIILAYLLIKMITSAISLTSPHSSN